VGSILSKLDETVKLAPALDVLIRHQLPIKGLTTGQRVPEDWEEADKARLVRQALRTPGKSAFDPQLDDLSHLFYPSHVAGDSKRTH
jgi:flagellar biosynthesis protein FlhF